MPLPVDPGAELLLLDQDLIAALDQDDRDALTAGAFDGDDVWFMFRTQDDDRVRPEHEALDGTVWRVGDPAAPVPPLDYGCRCFMEYVARPGSEAAAVLPAADKAPETHGAILTRYLTTTLDMNRERLARILTGLEDVPLGDRLGLATLSVQRRLSAMGLPDNLTTARPLARMLLAVKRPRPARQDPGPGGVDLPEPILPTPPTPITPATEQDPTDGDSDAFLDTSLSWDDRAESAAKTATPSWERPRDEWTAREIQANKVLGQVAASRIARDLRGTRQELVTVRGQVDTLDVERVQANADLTEARKARDRAALNAAAHVVGGPQAAAAFQAAEAEVARLTDHTTRLAQRHADLMAARKAIEDRILRVIRDRNPAPLGAVPDFHTRTAVWRKDAVLEWKTDTAGELMSRTLGLHFDRLQPQVKNGRGYAQVISIAGARGVRVVVNGSPHSRGLVAHELTHAADYFNPDRVAASVAFLRRRTAGNRLEYLSTLSPGFSYKKSEVARAGGFMSPYTAKDYGDAWVAMVTPASLGGGLKNARKLTPYAGTDATEVLTQGATHMVEQTADLLEKDPDLFYFTIRGLMGGI